MSMQAPSLPGVILRGKHTFPAPLKVAALAVHEGSAPQNFRILCCAALGAATGGGHSLPVFLVSRFLHSPCARLVRQPACVRRRDDQNASPNEKWNAPKSSPRRGVGLTP